MTYVSLDPENGDLLLTLPESMRPHQDELYMLLTEQFMEAAFDESTLIRMNQFVQEWLEKHGK